MFAYALLAAVLVSLISFSGALALAFNHKMLNKVLIFLVAFSAGTMMAGAFFHLLPESVALFSSGSMLPFELLIGGFAVFFVLERFIFWHHCHHANNDCHVHSFGYMNVIGDGIHNFLDGLVIAAAFLADTHVGIATTLAIISHEIPQEISDFGVLVHSGMKPSRALMFNFFSAVFAIVGVCTGWILAEGSEQFEPFLLAFSAGGFMYIAASDLVPELHKERNLKKSSISFVMFLFGIILMMLIRTFVGEGH